MSALTDALGRLDRERAVVLAALDAMSPAQRAFRPAPDAWSADEVADHLAKAESGQLEIVRRQVSAGESRRSLGQPSAPRRWLVERLMRSSVRVRMPAAVAPRVAPTGVAFETSRGVIAGCGEAWQTLAASIPPELEAVCVFAHPVAGPMTVAQTACFAASHLDHHRRQIARIQAAPGYPASARPVSARPGSG